MLLINTEECSGCKLCMLACSLKHKKSFNLLSSRIQVRSEEITNVYIPFICEHCGEHLCVDICPADAIYYDENLSILKVDSERCIGCGNCVKACPYNGIFLDRIDKAIKCDLCNGDPVCVKYCVPQAIKYVDIDKKSIETKIENILSKLKSGRM